ncbi:hypothetical protein JOB18_048678 [Solea senegalensis]|uniref:Endonuclease/exonuclease/phosphatase domain-containing protein n=1 Tax=Solea senegalensis TaxID=28829 RepID=A0AAV6QYC9_SOLSE|nr:hypothetical protein JOB18_048678 [Solea senegalensis]
MVSTFVGTDDPWLLAVLGFRSGSAHNYMSIFLGANVQDTQRMLTDQILCVEQANPDSLVIVLGDFNKGNLTHKLPKYRQFIKSPTREENILDHCYTTVRDAYHAPHAALGHSDHVMVHLITAYRQYLKLCKPGVRTSKKWTSEAVEEPLACFDSTDWDVFRTATNSLDESTEAVTSYISFCEDYCVPSRTWREQLLLLAQHLSPGSHHLGLWCQITDGTSDFTCSCTSALW